MISRENYPCPALAIRHTISNLRTGNFDLKPAEHNPL
jgi:hypothetical protein